MPSLNLLFITFLIFLLNNETKAQAGEEWVSPCPRLFVYEGKNNEPDKWYGIITLLSETDLNGIWLRIIFDRPSLQLGNWFGQVVTSDNKDYLVKNRERSLKALVPQTVRFYVKYNPNEPPPKLVSFRLNARTVCPEGVGTEAPTAAPELQTSGPDVGGGGGRPGGRPGGGNGGGGNGGGGNGGGGNGGGGNGGGGGGGSFFRPPESGSGGEEEDIFPSDFASLFRPSPRPTTNNNNNNGDVNEICGTVIKPMRMKRQTYEYQFPYYQNHYNYPNQYYPNQNPNNDNTQQIIRNIAQPRPLITYGQPTEEGEFPWHAALYHSKGIDLAYICGASLISKYHVITVAHCVTRRKSQAALNPDNLVVYLGKYYLKRFSSPGIQDRQVSKIIPHPQYNAQSYTNDIALVKFTNPAEFTDYVRPVCLWQESTDLSSVLNRQGNVVGWGFDETGKVTETLMQAKMPVVSQDMCIYSFPDFYSRFTSSNTYCAGFRNGTSVCNGDSGGGMVFPRPGSKRNGLVWQLRGLVSISVALQNQFKCDATHYVVFTDAAKYLDWIKKSMTT